LTVRPIPSWIETWDQYSLQFYDFSLSPAYRLLTLVVDICNLRCEAASTPPDKLQHFISRAVLLDQQFESWLTTLPETWNYAVYTAPAGHGDDAAYGCRYHIYYDLWTGSMWNTYRSARIMLNLVIVGWLKASSESTADLTIYSSESAHAIDIMHQLSRDICESVSFHLKSYPGCMDIPRAIGGYFVLWPLFAACNPPGIDPRLRRWVIERLDFIAHCMGIQQASSIARRLQIR
jgi:hypothetical protein